MRAVAAGEVDLGWVGTRVFDTLDVTSFQALTAPMLVDSYDLQDAVLHSTITHRMMRGLEPVGVVGLGVVPDALRKPIGVEGPLLTPSDWRGTTFGTVPSKSQEASIKALGATPAEVFGHQRLMRSRQGSSEDSSWAFTSTKAILTGSSPRPMSRPM